MSTSNKLTYLNETKQQLKQKINNLGGSIDDNTTFREYVEELQDIYDNLPKTSYAEGTEINLGVTSKGKLDFENDIVGYGDTEQESTNGINKIKIDSFSNGSKTFTHAGLTATLNDDGTVTINGTSTANAYFHLNTNLGERQNGGTFGAYYISGTGDTSISWAIYETGTSNGKINTTNEVNLTALDTTITYTTTRLAMIGGADKTFNNYTFGIMLVDNTTATTKENTPYEKYTNGASPNPDYPQTINSVTGNQEVVVRGKNLFSSELEVGTFTNSGLNNTSTNRLRSKDYIAVQPNTTYTMSVTNNTTYTLTASVSFYNKNDFTTPRTSYLNWSTGNILTFETPSDCTYIRTLFNLENSTITVDRLTNVMLERSNQATTYEPYITPTPYQLSLGDKELFEDSFIDRDSNGDWYFNDNMQKITLDGTETWNLSSNEKYFYNTNSIYPKSASGSTIVNSYCTHYIKDSYNNIYNGTPDYAFGFAYNNNRLAIRNKDIATVQALKTWLSTNNIEVVCPTNETIRTQITDTTLISQLEAWYNAHSNNGTTIITSNGELPMIIKCRALKGA